MENNVVSATTTDISKIHQDMNTLQVRFSKISSADFRGKSSSKPWKPEATPPRRRGGFNRGRGVDSLIMHNKVINLRIVRITVISMEIITKEMAMVLLEIEDKAKEILEVPCMVKVEDAVDLIKAQI